MTAEIFGPILPIVEYENYDEVMEFIGNNPKPLSMYYFGFNDAHFERLR